jgi:hypothetical protein
MPRKTARSGIKLGRSEMSGARLSHLGFQSVQKTPTIHLSSRFMWGIPAYPAFPATKSTSAGRLRIE